MFKTREVTEQTPVTSPFGKEMPIECEPSLGEHSDHAQEIIVPLTLPKLTKLEVFGNTIDPIDREYPTEEDLKSFPLDRRIKLQTIAYKNTSTLMAIQLKFNTNLVETPVF